MSKDKVKEEPAAEADAVDGEAPPAKKKPSLKLMLIAGAAALVVLGGGGGAAFVFLKPAPEAEAGHGKGGMRDLHVGWFRGVDDAHAIRDLILERLRRLKDAGLGDEDDVEPAPVARVAPRRLVPLLTSLRDETALLRLAAERAAGGR